MYHSLLLDVKFFKFLRDIDLDLASDVRRGACPRCEGALHCARYPRKPRGGPGDLGADYDRRESFCCADCRRRRTPPSVRFLGRKVYFAVVVMLATAMQHGVTARRLSELHALLGIGRRTLLRWRAWWQTIFAASPAWRAQRGMLGGPVNGVTLPLSLLERFRVDDLSGKVAAALRFLAPLVT